MPSVLKQDPRYFYKGSGSKRSRILYALASSVICKGDNGHWQPNYSNVLGSFAAGALFLAAIGIYGLLHHVVVQRTSEIGVRMALGARPSAVMALVLRQGLTLASVGAALGLIAAFSVSRVLAKLLYGIAPTDPLTFGLSVLLLLLVAGVSCWIPGRRASRIDPVLALRQD